jgi:hypothetical protein
VECKPVSLWPYRATAIGELELPRPIATAGPVRVKRNLHKKGLFEAAPYLIAILEVVRRLDHNWPDSRNLWLLFGDMESLMVGIPTLP